MKQKKHNQRAKKVQARKANVQPKTKPSNKPFDLLDYSKEMIKQGYSFFCFDLTQTSYNVGILSGWYSVENTIEFAQKRNFASLTDTGVRQVLIHQTINSMIYEGQIGKTDADLSKPATIISSVLAWAGEDITDLKDNGHILICFDEKDKVSYETIEEEEVLKLVGAIKKGNLKVVE